MQLSSVDVFAVGGAGESDRWEDIARKALYLDRDDFLPTRYKVSAKFKSVASTPPRSTAGPQPSDRSQFFPAKKRKIAVVKEVYNLSGKDPNNEDYEEDDTRDPKGEDNKDFVEGEDDVPDLVEDVATPPNQPSMDIWESRPSVETLPSTRTPRASSSMGRREKRKDRDPMTAVLESLLMMFADN